MAPAAITLGLLAAAAAISICALSAPTSAAASPPCAPNSTDFHHVDVEAHPPSRPPSPPAAPTPPPHPPVPLPSASRCNLTGTWRQYGFDPATSSPHHLLHSSDADINITMAASSLSPSPTSPSPTRFTFTCSSKKHHCLGLTSAANGTGELSATDNSVELRLANGTVYHGLVNDTFGCGLVSILSSAAQPPPFAKAISWELDSTPPAPPLNLDVAAATYLTPANTHSSFTAVAVGLLGQGPTIVVAGNGEPSPAPHPPQLLLNATAASNASLLLLAAKSSARPLPAASGLAVLATLKLGDRIDHLRLQPLPTGDRNSDDMLAAVVGSFGVAVLRLSASGAGGTLVFHDALSDLPHGSGGLCQNGDEACRVAIGADGTVAALVPTGGNNHTVLSFTSAGRRAGAASHTANAVTDIGILSQQGGSVAFTAFYDSSTGREPIVMPDMRVMAPTLDRLIYRNWWWGSGHPYRQPGPCDGDVADSRALRIRELPDGSLVFVGRSDGGNGVFHCQAQNVTRPSPMVSYDAFTSAYNMGAQAISYLARLLPATGQVLVGEYMLVRLPSDTKGNSLTTEEVAGSPDAAGNLYFAQTAACCIQNMANLTLNGRALGGNGDGAALLAVSADFTRRLLWHSFNSPAAPHGSGSAAVDVAVGGGLVVFLSNTHGGAALAEVAPLPATGAAAPDAQAAHLVLLNTLG